MIYALDLIAVAVFAASGTLAAMAANMDPVGIFVLASVTAIGGGTIRDLLLGRHPIFWIKDPAPLFVIIGSAIFTVAWTQLLPVPQHALLTADALGLALFAITGAQIAEVKGCSPLVVILMGTLTGSGGGVIRDVLTARVPLLLRADIYASAAVAGIVVYLVLRAIPKLSQAAMVSGIAVVAITRLLAVAFDLSLPALGMPK
ncbi:trimeric intracellular cation channel family protein [Luteolibacter pohnpeiensis]|uniref:Trimeric intracellular cation channel family protein n=1 Tax=Luteolibacter pohnpeiensis TaxID=454153 RepID=A0A934S423_9BACT|nr:trimeric intracellular cation channel family protein [Luteolibacter pohnpeiensis]MBK1881927.1 trimeric intracellular cation channel family protein [Luteolibacter pohnpeiensis]